MSSSASLRSATRMAPLEQRGLTMLQRLRSATAFVRDLQSAEDTYAREFAKVPKVKADALHSTSAPAPELARICSAFDALMRTQSDAKAQLAQDLAHSVVQPLETFADQQAKQLRRLLLEVAQALEREQTLQSQLCARAREHGTPVATTEDLSATALARRQQLRATVDQRTTERRTVRTRLEELHLAELQQRAVVHNALEQLVAIYRRKLVQIRTSATELQAKVGAWQTEAPPAPAMLAPEHESDDDTWTSFLKTCERHVEMTEWMNSVCVHVATVEDAMVKRLLAMRKLHPAADVFASNADSHSGSKTLCRDGAAVRMLSAWMHVHTLLTVSLRDPISRTLTFSAHKQRRIRKELLESLGETTKLVQRTRKSVAERTLQHRKLVRAGEGRDGSASRLLVDSVAGSLSSHVADAMKLHLSTFGLRSAVAATLSKAAAASYAAVNESSDSSAVNAKHANTSADKELVDARTHLESLERSEAEQRHEIRSTLRSTSLLSVKTLELMVGDYVKHVCKALAALNEQLEALNAKRGAASEVSLQPQEWLLGAAFESEDPIVSDLVRALARPDKDDARSPRSSASMARNDVRTRASVRARRSSASQLLLLQSACSAWTRDSTSRSWRRVDTSHVLAALKHCCERTAAFFSRLLVHDDMSTLIATAALALAVFALAVMARRLSCLSERWDDIVALQRAHTADLALLRARLTH